MPQPWFLNIEHTMRLHRSLIEKYGGAEGVREVGLLHSALAMPQASFGGAYLHSDLFEMAAAYLFHLVQNHPFYDGNKRIGAASAIVFLSMNDVEILADADAFAELVWAVARGEVGKNEIADFLRSNGSSGSDVAS